LLIASLIECKSDTVSELLYWKSLDFEKFSLLVLEQLINLCDVI
jgi:hypothetical protein